VSRQLCAARSEKQEFVRCADMEIVLGCTVVPLGNSSVHEFELCVSGSLRPVRAPLCPEACPLT
jgi:hypothetical protein